MTRKILIAAALAATLGPAISLQAQDEPGAVIERGVDVAVADLASR